MNLVLTAISVFICAFLNDVVWALYIRRTGAGRAASAATYGALILAFGAWNIWAFLQTWWMLGFSLVGAWLGTFLAVRREHARTAAETSDA